MKQRIAWLILLALGGAGSLLISAYWSRVLASPVSDAKQQHAEYLAHTWMITFAIIAAAWIWLLVRTIRFRFATEESFQ